jgi:hypothetical protein
MLPRCAVFPRQLSACGSPNRQSIETISDIVSSLLYLSVSPEELLTQDLQTLLRQNEVKRVIIRKLLKNLSAMPIDELIQVNEVVNRGMVTAQNQEAMSS